MCIRDSFSDSADEAVSCAVENVDWDYIASSTFWDSKAEELERQYTTEIADLKATVGMLEATVAELERRLDA